MAKELATSITDGDAYTFTAPTADIDAADTVILIKNTGQRNLRIHSIEISGGNATSLYTIHKQLGTTAGTPTGTAVLGVSLSGRKDNGYAANGVLCKSDETGYATQGTIIKQVAVLATLTLVVPMHDCILGINECIAVDQVTESAAGGATIIAFAE